MTDTSRRFEAEALPHLDAAYNFARWLARSESDAEDIVQDAMLRAFKVFGNFRGENPKPWLLAIVRNCWLSRMGDPRRKLTLGSDQLETMASEASDPEEEAMQSSESRRLQTYMALLPDEFREVLVLREMEDLSYQQIAEALAIPTGTVMSRLARARGLLREKWSEADELR